MVKPRLNKSPLFYCHAQVVVLNSVPAMGDSIKSDGGLAAVGW
jgi:hypothetical protein